jgi:hypothetical protein
MCHEWPSGRLWFLPIALKAAMRTMPKMNNTRVLTEDNLDDDNNINLQTYIQIKSDARWWLECIKTRYTNYTKTMYTNRARRLYEYRKHDTQWITVHDPLNTDHRWPRQPDTVLKTVHRYVAGITHSHDEFTLHSFVVGTRRIHDGTRKSPFRCRYATQPQRNPHANDSSPELYTTRTESTTEALSSTTNANDRTQSPALNANRTVICRFIYGLLPNVRGLPALGTRRPTATVLQEHSSNSRTFRWKSNSVSTVNSTMAKYDCNVRHAWLSIAQVDRPRTVQARTWYNVAL